MAENIVEWQFFATEKQEEEKQEQFVNDWDYEDTNK